MPTRGVLDPISVADLLNNLGNIPARRVRLTPTPGTATERDVVTVWEKERRLYELVDGTLVEKAVGMRVSFLAVEICSELRAFVRQHKIGFVLGADGMTRLMQKLVRIPDAAYYSWSHFPTRKVPDVSILGVPPDLAVEVLSKGNTKKEIERKLKEYFLGGSRLVWVVNPKQRTARSHTAPDRFVEIHEDGTLDGGEVLPGFRLSVRDLFAEMPEDSKKRRTPA